MTPFSSNSSSGVGPPAVRPTKTKYVANRVENRAISAPGIPRNQNIQTTCF